MDLVGELTYTAIFYKIRFLCLLLSVWVSAMDRVSPARIPRILGLEIGFVCYILDDACAFIRINE